jgi:glycosyltransferase involved in cell wall biosynthesis
MRVLFINTYDIGGGAAVVAARLGQALNSLYGTENFYLAGTLRAASGNTAVTRGKVGLFVEKILDRVLSAVGAQYVFFPFSSLAIVDYIRTVKPDVINIHNTHGGYFQTDLLKRISALAPVVWTLHDMWSFTGNAAHTFGNDSWKRMENDDSLTSIYPSIGRNTGRWLLQRKRSIYKQSRITLVTPSAWLANLARQSPVFEGKEIRHIFNGLNLDMFKPLDKAACKTKFGIPPEKKVVMFSAEHLKGNLWKGGDDLKIMLKGLSEHLSQPVHLLAVGSGELEFAAELSNMVVHHTGYVHSEAEMVQVYNAADLFLYPTRADNLPNVLVEAIACGVPSVTFDVGGCKEIIESGRNGLVVKNASSTSAIAELLSDPVTLHGYGTEARKVACSKFSDAIMAEAYFQMFKSLINSAA